MPNVGEGESMRELKKHVQSEMCIFSIFLIILRLMSLKVQMTKISISISSLQL